MGVCVMKEFNLIDTGHGSGLPGTGNKLQKGNAGNESGQGESFASMIDQAGHTPEQKSMGTAFTSSLLGGGKNAHSGASHVKGNIDFDSPFFGKGGMGGTDKENVLSEGKDGAGKTNQLFPLKSKGGKIDALPEKLHVMPGKGLRERVGGGVGNLSESNGLKEKEAGKNRFLGRLTSTSLKQGSASKSPMSNVVGAAVGMDETFKDDKHARVATLLGEKSKGGKNVATVGGDGGSKDNEVAKNSRGVKDVSILSKFTVKDGGAANEKDGGGKSVIESLVRYSGLEDDETVMGHGKKGVTQSSDHKREFLGREMPQSHSGDKNSSVGGYQHAPSEAAKGTKVIHESANNSGIKAEALINRIVNSVKGPGRVRIALNPPHLGTLDVDVLVRANKVHIILQAENNNVRQVLLSNMDSLKSSLHNQGLIVDSIDVSLQERSDRGYYESGRNDTLFRDSANRRGNEEDDSGRGDSSSHDFSLAGEGGSSVQSDGHISLFV